MSSEPNILAFVSGSKEEIKKQKSEIKEYCKKRYDTTIPDNKFISEWVALEKELKDKGYIIITDVRVFSDDYNELAGKLFFLMIEHQNFVEPVDKKQYEKLKSYQPGNYPKALLMNEGHKKRMLVGLEKICREILKGDDNPTTQTT